MHLPGRCLTKPVNGDNNRPTAPRDNVSSGTSGSCCKVRSQLTNQGAWERRWNSNTLWPLPSKLVTSNSRYINVAIVCCWDMLEWLALCNQHVVKDIWKTHEEPKILAKVLIHSKQSDRMDKPSSIREAHKSFMFQLLHRLHRLKSLLEFSKNDLHAAPLVVMNQRFNWRGTKNQEAVALCFNLIYQ